jgi:hypothetical protein
MPLLSLRILALAITVTLSVIGCASSTKIVNQWVDPEYGPSSFRRILVVGVSKQPSIRRTFEDEFVAKLKSEGVDAVPSYRYIPEDAQVDEDHLRETVKRANADGALITRLVRVQRKTEFTPGFYQPAPGFTFGFYRGYSSAWLGYYEPPRIYRYDVYVSETSLYDLRKNRLVWSGTVQTTDPGDINKEIKQYVEKVIDALKSKDILPPSKRAFLS